MRLNRAQASESSSELPLLRRKKRAGHELNLQPGLFRHSANAGRGKYAHVPHGSSGLADLLFARGGKEMRDDGEAADECSPGTNALSHLHESRLGIVEMLENVQEDSDVVVLRQIKVRRLEMASKKSV